MHYPLIGRELLLNLRLAHAVYNTAVAALFFYHAGLGLSIRRARLARAPLPFPAIKRHRALGPVLAAMGGLGFCIGLTLVLLHTGNILEYPLHFIAGVMIVALLLSTFLLSRKIKGQDSPYRTPHFYLGLAILVLYLAEVFLGIGVLF